MSRSQLHDWECAIEKLGGENSKELLEIAQDIYNTAYVRGKNSKEVDFDGLFEELKAIETPFDHDKEVITECIDVIEKYKN